MNDNRIIFPIGEFEGGRERYGEREIERGEERERRERSACGNENIDHSASGTAMANSRSRHNSHS